MIAAVAEGDRDALAALYDRWAPVLLALARRILRQEREAEDLAHDVFLEVWHHAGDYDPARGTVRAWLVTRLRSRALDRVKSPALARVISLRREDAEGTTAAATGMRDPAADPSFAPDCTRVRVALMRLEPAQRQVLELRYFEGLSSSEIAKRARLPLGTVKSRVAGALARLRAVFAVGLVAG